MVSASSIQTVERQVKAMLSGLFTEDRVNLVHRPRQPAFTQEQLQAAVDRCVNEIKHSGALR